MNSYIEVFCGNCVYTFPEEFLEDEGVTEFTKMYFLCPNCAAKAEAFIAEGRCHEDIEITMELKTCRK